MAAKRDSQRRSRCGETGERRDLAFSLLELLVVVATIALLAALLAPTLAKARETARRAACLSNLHQLHVALALYAQDNADQVPVGYRSASKQFNSMVYSVTAGQWVLFGHLTQGGYVPAPAALFCPSERMPKFAFNTAQNPWPLTSVPAANIQSGYAFRPEKELPDDLASPPPSFPLPLMLRLTDLKALAISADLTAAANRVKNRHRDGVNVGYGDGSARWVSLGAFAQPDNVWPEPTLPPVSTFNSTQDRIWHAFDAN